MSGGEHYESKSDSLFHILVPVFDFKCHIFYTSISFFLLLPAVFVMILIWGICVFEIGRATIISSQTKRITQVILAFLASLLTISINPIGMSLLDFINWGIIHSFTDHFSKADWIIFLIHMLLFWLGEEIGYFSQKGLF